VSLVKRYLCAVFFFFFFTVAKKLFQFFVAYLTLVCTHQEKQFVAGTGVVNIKQKTGKHCSLRWKAMALEEKRLYEVQEHFGTGVPSTDTGTDTTGASAWNALG
jgi:hypothetical protein